MRSYLAAALLVPGLVLTAMPAGAGMIDTQQLLTPADSQRARVETLLAREDVQRELEAFGVSPGDAADRVASLTPAELQALASRVDSLPAGGDISTIELLLIIIIIVLLILILLELLGAIDIFPRI